MYYNQEHVMNVFLRSIMVLPVTGTEPSAYGRSTFSRPNDITLFGPMNTGKLFQFTVEFMGRCICFIYLINYKWGFCKIMLDFEFGF